MKNLVCLFFTIALFSCGSTTHFTSESLKGIYAAKGLDYSYNLELLSDSSFKFNLFSMETKSSCKGKWAIKDDYIILSCEPSSNVYETLQAGYIGGNVFKLKVKSDTEITYREASLIKVSK